MTQPYSIDACNIVSGVALLNKLIIIWYAEPWPSTRMYMYNSYTIRMWNAPSVTCNYNRKVLNKYQCGSEIYYFQGMNVILPPLPSLNYSISHLVKFSVKMTEYFIRVFENLFVIKIVILRDDWCIQTSISCLSNQ